MWVLAGTEMMSLPPGLRNEMSRLCASSTLCGAKCSRVSMQTTVSYAAVHGIFGESMSSMKNVAFSVECALAQAMEDASVSKPCTVRFRNRRAASRENVPSLHPTSKIVSPRRRSMADSMRLRARSSKCQEPEVSHVMLSHLSDRAPRAPRDCRTHTEPSTFSRSDLELGHQ